MELFRTFYYQECIPIGCVPTAAVASTRCQYWGGGLGRPPQPRQTPLWSQISPCGQTDASENNTFPSIGKYRADTPTLREILKAVISQVQIEPERLLPPTNEVWGKLIF